MKLWIIYVFLFYLTFTDCRRYTRYFSPRKSLYVNNMARYTQAVPTLKKESECKNENICLTEECVHLSSSILKSIDTSVSPCDDFYKFSCGGWQKEHEEMVNEENIFYAANLNQMPDKINKVIKKLMSKEIVLDEEFYESTSYKHMFAFHKSCMDQESITKEGMRPAVELLRRLEGFQVGTSFDPDTFDLTRAIISMSKFNGFPLFEISMDTALANSSYWQVAISAPKHKGLLKTIISQKQGKSTPTKKEYFRHKGSKLLRQLLSDLNEEIFMLEFLNELKSDTIHKERQNIHQPNPTSANVKFHPKVATHSIDEFLKHSHINQFKFNRNPSRVIVGADSVDSSSNKIKLQDENKEKSKVKSGDSQPQPLEEHNLLDELIKTGGNLDDLEDLTLDELLSLADPNMPSMEDLIPIGALDDLGVEDMLRLFEYTNSIVEGNETQAPPLEILESIGFMPKVTRQVLYREIEKELMESKKFDIENTIKEMVFTAEELVDVNYNTENSLTYVANKDSNDSDDNSSQYFNVTLGDKGEGVDSEIKLSREAEKAIAAIVDFVMKLRDIEPSEREQMVVIQQGKGFNEMSIRDLQKAFPLVKWQVIIEEVYGIQLSPDDEVVVFFPAYLDKLTEFLEKQELWLIHSGMLSIFIYDQLKELVTIDEEQDREEFCFMATRDVFTDVLSHMYLNHLGEDHVENLREKVLPMMKKITETTVRFVESSWMDDADKEMAKLKLSKIDLQVAALDNHRNISYINDIHKRIDVKDQLFFDNVMNIYKSSRETLRDLFEKPVNSGQLIWSYTTEPFTINAFHLQSTNSIVFPEALFYPPYYYPNTPAYFSYASAGTAYAHELWHALDFTGTLFDGDGNMNRPFSNEMRETMKEKVSCFNELLEDAFTKEVNIEGLTVVMVVDNNATLNENLADIASIAHTYASYFEDEDMNSDPLLPALNYTKEQLFFIGIAQPYCAILPDLAKVILMHMDEHLLHDMRVNGLMMNFPPFHKAFSCQPADRMVAPRTCPIL